MRSSTLKRMFDLVGAVLALVLMAPLILLLSPIIRLIMGPPVLFRQLRPGLSGKLFTMYKFRTMRDLRGPDGRMLLDQQRLTHFGRLLRSSSLDELPELWNVLRGEMSLVGPRPLLVEYLDRYTHEQTRRHDVRPGITGWAQVNGRNSLSWDEKFKLDVWYVDHWTVGLDLRILWLTLAKVLKRDGISAESHPTMPNFLGSRDHGK